MYTYRGVLRNDFEIIASFPQDENELFHMFPNAIYPLTPIQIEEGAKNRLKPTVVLLNQEIVAYANLYAHDGDSCWIGNVIVSPSYRGKGVAQHLIGVMEDIAMKELNVKNLKLSCHNTNIRGIFFYTKLGYKPYEISKIKKSTGEIIAGIRMIKDI
ncbi:MAG: GNAT family N-acetyltransferase [Bacillota bacterium]